MTTELATRALPELSELPPDKLRVLQDVICPRATPAELSLFWTYCQRTGLDPFAKQIYAIKRKQKNDDGTWGERLTIQTAIDGFRVIAERKPEYAGQVGPFWCGKDGVWKDVWMADEFPAAARVGILRKDFSEPLFAVAHWCEYVQTTKEGEPVAMWKRMAANQLAKCAEALALRRAFPNDMSGIYTGDEMGQADNGGVRRVENTSPQPTTGGDELIGDKRAEQVKEVLAARGKTTDDLLDQFSGEPRVFDHGGDYLKVADWPAGMLPAIKQWCASLPQAPKANGTKPVSGANATQPEYWIGMLHEFLSKKGLNNKQATELLVKIERVNGDRYKGHQVIDDLQATLADLKAGEIDLTTGKWTGTGYTPGDEIDIPF